MGAEQKLASFFKLNDTTWQQHANPWSIWTRFIILPLLTLAIWSRVWIGIYCWIPIVLILVWTWINPRAFGKPKTNRHWSSKSVMGERVWLNRKSIPIPAQHQKMILILNIFTSFGLPFYIYGLYQFHLWATFIGLLIVVIGKLWFLDRMVWLFEDMKSETTYKDWLY